MTKYCIEIKHLKINRIKSQLPWFTKNIKNTYKKTTIIY